MLPKKNNYAYGEASGDDDDDDDGSSCGAVHDLPPFSSQQPLSLFRKNVGNDPVVVTEEEKHKYRYVLGKKYDRWHKYCDPSGVFEDKSYEASLFWFTYRTGFPAIEPYEYTSDAGWGCMLRASQMLISHALRIHFKGREWLPPPDYRERRKRGSFYCELLTWFADLPGADCCYSFHNMVACGLSLEKFPGEWYGPGTACHVLRQLCNVHRSYLKRRIENGFYRKENSNKSCDINQELFQVIVTEGCIYRDQIEEEMKNSDEASIASGCLQLSCSANDCHDPLLHPPLESPRLDWKSPLLLLIPLRLGLSKFNESYKEILARTFSFPQSVGIIGGRPAHAIWYFGAAADGSTLYGLDPHTIQQSPTRDPRQYGAVSISDSYIDSVHTKNSVTMKMNKVDPSLALGFYCRDRDDFESLLDLLDEVNNASSISLVSIVDNSPDYTADLTMLNEMMASNEFHDEGTDEDDYVFL